MVRTPKKNELPLINLANKQKIINAGIALINSTPQGGSKFNYINNIQFSQRSVLPVVEIYELKKISLTFYAGESNRFAYLNAKSRNKSAGSFN